MGNFNNSFPYYPQRLRKEAIGNRERYYKWVKYKTSASLTPNRFGTEFVNSANAFGGEHYFGRS